MQSDSPKTREQELEEALRQLLSTAEAVAYTECPFTGDESDYQEARTKAEALLARPEGNKETT